MKPLDLEARVKELEQQAAGMRQILRSLATKEDLKRFATKEDLKRFATKEDLKRFATKKELKRFATKRDLERFATKRELKEELKRYATKEDLREEGERTRRHFDIVSERMHDEIRLIAGGQLGTEAKLDRERLERLVLERRVTTLEARVGASPPAN